MQKISNDIDAQSQVQSHSVVTDAIKVGSETLSNIVNRDETQIDSRATLVFRESIGEVLTETVKKL